MDLTAPSPLWHLSSTLVYSLAAEAGVAPARLRWLDATDVADRRALFPEAATSDGTLDGVLSIVDDGSGGADATEAAARLAALNASFFAALAPPLQLARLSYVGAVASGACRTAAPAEVCSLQLDVIMATLGATAWQYTAIVDGSGAVVHPALAANSSRDDVQAYLHYAGGGAKAFACALPCASPPSAPPDPPAPPAPPPLPAFPTSDCVWVAAPCADNPPCEVLVCASPPPSPPPPPPAPPSPPSPPAPPPTVSGGVRAMEALAVACVGLVLCVLTVCCAVCAVARCFRARADAQRAKIDGERDSLRLQPGQGRV